MQRQHFLALLLFFLFRFITPGIMRICDKAALTHTDIIVSGHCHSLFMDSKFNTLNSGIRLTGTFCDINYMHSHGSCIVFGALSHSGHAVTHGNWALVFQGNC